jgi:putative aldouronate transport system substrate-binding protein
MDNLFSMYGVAMWEGFPEWDVYEGQLTYAGVTKNMKDALAFCASLYKEGLMDPETLLNDKAGWDGKVWGNRVGVYYHLVQFTWQFYEWLYQSSKVEGVWELIPAISAPGYQGFYPEKKINAIWWVVPNTKDQGKIDAVMKVIDVCWDWSMADGPEGMKWVYDANGNKSFLPDNFATMEDDLIVPTTNLVTSDAVAASYQERMKITTDPVSKAGYAQSIRNVQNIQQYGKAIAGDGIPAGIYEGYPDIQSHTLYQQYASKIITGEYSIDKFDEFVKLWYAQGGTEVTKAARAWYGTGK